MLIAFIIKVIVLLMFAGAFSYLGYQFSQDAVEEYKAENEMLAGITVKMSQRIDDLEEALKRAEQTTRNLSDGFLSGELKTIAANEAANIRTILEKGMS